MQHSWVLQKPNETRIHAKPRWVLPNSTTQPKQTWLQRLCWRNSPRDATQFIAFIKEALATGLVKCEITGFQNVPAILVVKIDRLLRQLTARTRGGIDATLSTLYHINARTITPFHDQSFTTILGFRKLRPNYSRMDSNDFSSNATSFHLPCKHNTCQARIGICRDALAVEGWICRTIRYGIDVASDPHNPLRFQDKIQHVMAQDTSSLCFAKRWKQKTKKKRCSPKKIRNQTQKHPYSILQKVGRGRLHFQMPCFKKNKHA